MKVLEIILKIFGALFGAAVGISLVWGLFYICGIPFVVEGTDKLFAPKDEIVQDENTENETEGPADRVDVPDWDGTETVSRINFSTNTIYIEV